jgi:cation transport ATPase
MKPDVQENAGVRKPDRKYRRGIELAALLIAFILSVIGIGITDFRPMMSYRYWGAMTLILALIGIVMGWARQQRSGQPAREMLMTQLVHWGATFATVAGIYMLLGSGRLNYENTGLVVLLTLALATFLDGYRVSWSFGALGGMMFVTAMLGAYIEQYIWVVLIMIICTAVVIVILEKSRARTLSEEDGEGGQKAEGGDSGGQS